jgi:hypothetical protein
MPYKLLTPRPYKDIKEMVTKYHEAMNRISIHLKKDLTVPQIDVNKEPLGFYISRKELESIIAIISQVDTDAFEKYLLLFGIELEDNQNLTVCIVGADKDGNILAKYKENDTTFGHEKWPDKTSITLAASKAELQDFLNKK